MHSAIVMPCLDEETTLSDTCASLGFGRGVSHRSPERATLVLVDNGSQDATWNIMKDIRRESAPGAVVIIQEPERGYVPPRHRGVLEARTLAQSIGADASDFLILQADADTLYSEDYVARITANAAECPGDHLFEGVCHAPPGFDAAYPSYGIQCALADAAVAHLFVDEDDDIIVDDKVCAYTLQNYERWGGHRREFTGGGVEVYAETTRLYTKARLNGARRIRVSDARAWPSRRKIFQNPLLYFATMGFPREPGWNQLWQSAATHVPLERFGTSGIGRDLLTEAFTVRRAHALVLFSLLPAYVAMLSGSTTRLDHENQLADLIPFLLPLSKADLLENTATLFEKGFAIIDTARPLLLRHLRLEQEISEGGVLATPE